MDHLRDLFGQAMSGINPALLGQFPTTSMAAIFQQQQAQTQLGAQRDIATRDKAHDNALTLFRARLGEQEWRLFERTSTLTVSSRLWPGTFYLLRPNDAVKVVKDGRVTASLCVLTTGGEPWPDRLMTILDLIASDERRLWQMANLPATAPDSARGSIISRWPIPLNDPVFWMYMSPVIVVVLVFSVLLWLRLLS